MANGSERQKQGFMYVQKLRENQMSNQSDILREVQSAKLCDLLWVKIDCYTREGIVVYDVVGDATTNSVMLPNWLVRRLIRLRPALQELNEKDQYENQLIHNRYLGMIYDSKN